MNAFPGSVPASVAVTVTLQDRSRRTFDHPVSVLEVAQSIGPGLAKNTVAGKIDGQAKAMVVTRSRLHAVRTQAALAAYIAKKGYDQGERPLRTLVAFSGSLVDPEAPEAPAASAAEVMEAIDGDEPISDDTHVTGDADSLFDSSDNMPVAPNNEQ